MNDPYTWWAIIAAVLIGHFGLNVAIYNRINGFGWPRKVIKSIVWIFFLLTIAVPILIAISYGDLILDLASGRRDASEIPIPLAAYSIVCLSTWILLGVPWLLWRPIFGLEWIPTKRTVEVVDTQKESRRSLALSIKCNLQSRLPLNQVFDLSIEEIELPVAGLPQSLDGYRIAHLSDIHLTGDIHPDFSRFAVQRATNWRPDLMALTGDIIDSQHCVDWLPEIFAPAQAPDGCYYVLGNHDTRIVDSKQTRSAMSQAGWTDLGSRTLSRALGNVPSLLIGNEHPWFRRPAVSAAIDSSTDEAFRLLLSHSPDQIWWARKHRVTLMLAGHTHGGQGRLPLIGPVLGPSFHGTRFASGDFFKPPTTMHVSRGLSGTHLLRIRCRPQLSLLTLRSNPTGGGDI